VCGYARVSTGSKAQAESYATQVAYFTEKIENNPLWEFAGMYADEAATGTKVRGREEFQAMIEACENGEIDLILTKSVTRFARNTVECIQTIRKLKALGVGILFEKENINTLTEKSELMLSILSSIAQGESEDFSGNNRWAVEKRFQEGTFVIGTPAYGYKNDENGELVIVEEEAETVRWIFDAYLNGLGTYLIAKELNKKEIPTIRSGEKWCNRTIQEILTNPVYEGSRLQQRTYTESQFPFVRKANTGQRNQYLIEDDHEPIVTHEEAEAVRKIMEYRSRSLKMGGGKYKNRYLFSGRIICGECGEVCSHIQPRSREKKRGGAAKWKCKNYIYQNHVSCTGGLITDGQVKAVCVSAINQMIQDKMRMRPPVTAKETVSMEYRKLDRRLELAKNRKKQNAATGKTRQESDDIEHNHMHVNTRQENNPADIMTLIYERAQERYRTLEINDTDYRTGKMQEVLSDRNELTEFDEDLYRKLITRIVIYKNNTAKVVFLNGSSIKVEYQPDNHKITEKEQK